MGIQKSAAHVAPNLIVNRLRSHGPADMYGLAVYLFQHVKGFVYFGYESSAKLISALNVSVAY